MSSSSSSIASVIGIGKAPLGYEQFWVRFVQVVAFLFMIDPVRGEPSEHTFDQHRHNRYGREDHVTRKFLDSFALVAAGDKSGADAASAVCMEKEFKSGPVLRLARNKGISPERTKKLQDLIDDLSAVASKSKTPSTVQQKTNIANSIARIQSL